MEKNNSRPALSFLRGPVARVVTLVLLVQTAVYYALPKAENVPPSRPLKEFPAVVGPWVTTQEAEIEKEVREVLKADDTLSRQYGGPAAAPISLFVAFFRSQRAGAAPHSPKVCLPGAGWIPTESEIVAIQVPGRVDGIPVNRNTIERGEHKSVVLYWFQSRDRVVADEYRAKFYSMYDSIRYRRSDTSLVRVVVPVVNGDENAARVMASKFVQDMFGALRGHLPG